MVLIYVNNRNNTKYHPANNPKHTNMVFPTLAVVSRPMSQSQQLAAILKHPQTVIMMLGKIWSILMVPNNKNWINRKLAGFSGPFLQIEKLNFSLFKLLGHVCCCRIFPQRYFN